MSLKIRLKQYFCQHPESKTTMWLERNSIHSQTVCIECDKPISGNFSRHSHQQVIDLLERSKTLKEGEKLSL